MREDDHMIEGQQPPDSEACTFGVDSGYVELAAEVFTLLSDPTRIRIILALRDGELAVGELAGRVGKSATSVSQHLAKLRWGKVVATRQDGARVYYRLVDGHVRQLVQQAVFQAEHVVDDQPRHHRATHPAPQASAETTTGTTNVNTTNTGTASSGTGAR